MVIITGFTINFFFKFAITMMNQKLSLQQLNYINIGLMIVACISAMFYPFETFLFVYAFLGPLHYLTEISWLHDKQYYTKRKYDYLFLLGVGVFITFIDFNLVKNIPAGTGTFLIFLAFMAGLIFTVTSNWTTRIIFLFISIIAANFISGFTAYDAIFGSFLPTLIHVFVFTGLFILVGALKGRDLSGILSLVIFIGIAFSFFYIMPDRSNYHVSEYVKNSYGYVNNEGGFTDGFISLNETIRRVFNLHEFGSPDMSQEEFIKSVNNYFYSNKLMLSIMAFIGFAYSYHYLNWFSKTSVIQWHNIPRSRFIAVVVLWLGSIALYAYDYSVGLKWLFFLSFTHVLLEFPLNNLTFINIGKEIKSIATGSKTVKV